MNKINIIILIFVIALSSCSDAGDRQSTASEADTVSNIKMATDSNMINAGIDSASKPVSKLNWQGTYKGVLPCADCSGIATTFVLLNDNTYEKTIQYLDKKGSKPEEAGKGSFTWLTDSTIQLQGIKESEAPDKYFVGKDMIVQLDAAGNRIMGSLGDKYSLVKALH